ncbi:uncharacterized protein CDAR_236631 [Caerostris darwini]|uniref:Uncharacterized protein n=1 Tax=Caerostris darwini TaxID=1538125 RepID=A0AAV4VNN1_9ARAC|nr:uncharacterized protein CDAR_236631 [Caerostris darwini]
MVIDKRQVTYGDGHYEFDEGDDSDTIRPITKKPLPSQLVYPGDLSSFYTTDTPRSIQSDLANKSSSNIDGNDSVNPKNIRQKRSTFNGRINRDNKNIRIPPRNGKFSINKENVAMESKLYSSYHKPSVSIMNDVPVEMSFDGAGFLRYDDDEFDDEKKTDPSKNRNPSGRSSKSQQSSNNKALDDFRKVFNVSRERSSNQVKYDDELQPPYHGDIPAAPPAEDKTMEYGTQGAENGTPLSVDFMTNYQNAFQNAYQNAMFNNPQFSYAASQLSQNPQMQSYDPFSFNYPSNPFGGQPNVNQMVMPQTMQQDAFIQNHRIPQNTNTGTIAPQTVYSSIPQQAFSANSMYTPTVNTQPTMNSQSILNSQPTLNSQPILNSQSTLNTHKTRRRRRSISSNDKDIFSSASELAPDHYRYTRASDQQDASSGFIPIAGNYNGGTIQLSYPYYGRSPPSYSHRPPVHSIPAYSMPISTEGRQYGGTVEHFYHPSEARRYSYGILGSGNFEVIRGGVFPGQRQQSYHGGYQEHRTPYVNEGYNNNNYGTTEIIIDGPIQGFQGFDNFPIHLINALTKHSEIAVQPEHQKQEANSAEN